MDRNEPTDAQQRAIDAEAALYAAFDELLPDFAEIAAELWHIGDGEGGYVIRRLEDTVEEINGPRRVHTPTTRKQKIPGTLRTQVYERDRYRCVECGTWEELSVDHIIAEANGGPTTLDNLQTLCRPCNTAKGTS